MRKILIPNFTTILAICLTLIGAISCSESGNVESGRSRNFNSNWQFTKLFTLSSDTIDIVNQGSDWSSQYNSTYSAETTSLELSGNMVTEEHKHLESQEWLPITIPHNPAVENLTILHQWQGICYYKKIFTPEQELSSQTIQLEFEGAMHLADIWLNGEHIKQHAGGYTPFVIDLTNRLKIGESNTLLVRLDNRNNPTIPPGKPVEDLDFNYHGGIYRDVNLIVKDRVHITNPIFSDVVAGGGVFVTYPMVSKELATVQIKTEVNNSRAEKRGVTIKHQLISKSNGSNPVANCSSEIQIESKASISDEQILEVKSPKLWSPSEPNLYTLRTTVLDSKTGDKLDVVDTQIGIRDLFFSKETGFVINGDPLRLVGSNRHQEYPYIGNAIPDIAQYRDIYHIKESGFNLVRLGHYMQDPSVLDACDELGLLVIEPIPGWQFFNKSKSFCDLTYRDIRAMIRRDRNHPSVILWETILNEAWPPSSWKDRAVEVAHEEFSGSNFYTSGDSYGYYGWDVQYNDWSEGFNRPNNSKKAGFIREYYDFEFGGHYSTTRKTRADGEEAMLQNLWNAQWSHNRYRAYYPETSGDAVWSMYDYNRGCCDNICYSGVADIFRVDKFSLNFYKSQMPVGTPLPSGEFKPFIFVANYWDNQPTDSKVIVYGNVDEIELFVNGKSIGRQRCDNGLDSDYSKDQTGWTTGGNPFDSGNCNQLNYPPFTFKKVKWEPNSTLTAVGYIEGVRATESLLHSPQEPTHLTIEYFESGYPATHNDLLIVNVSIKDKSSVTSYSSSDIITLNVISGGDVVGPDNFKSEAGVASFLVRTESRGDLILKATTSELKSDEFKVKLN